jgi:hypothetical protein
MATFWRPFFMLSSYYALPRPVIAFQIAGTTTAPTRATMKLQRLKPVKPEPPMTTQVIIPHKSIAVELLGIGLCTPILVSRAVY